MSHFTALCLAIFSGFLVYVWAAWFANYLGIETDEPLKQQSNSDSWFLGFLISIPLSAIPSFFLVVPIFGGIMVKLGWLNKAEASHFNKYGRFPARCLK